MSLGSAIPWRIALQQSPPPLYRPESMLHPPAETVNHHLLRAGEFSTGVDSTKRTAAQARSLADELGVDPLAYLLNLLAVDATMELEFAADGTERRVKLPVSRELKIDISKSLAGFFYPKLNAQQITGPNEGPIELARASSELERAMATPGGVEIIQRTALLIAGQPDALPAPAIHAPDNRAKALPAPARDPMETLERDPLTGHWRK